MKGYIQIGVFKDGLYAFSCWQIVEDGLVVGHMNAGEAMIKLPASCETRVLDPRDPSEQKPTDPVITPNPPTV